jgi:hypothetical protein
VIWAPRGPSGSASFYSTPFYSTILFSVHSLPAWLVLAIGHLGATIWLLDPASVGVGGRKRNLALLKLDGVLVSTAMVGVEGETAVIDTQPPPRAVAHKRTIGSLPRPFPWHPLGRLGVTQPRPQTTATYGLWMRPWSARVSRQKPAGLSVGNVPTYARYPFVNLAALLP